MIDIHSHLLPGIDDGPRNWEQSVALCRAMREDGILSAIATPHLIDGIYNNVRSRVEPMVRELNERLNAAGIDLDVLPGAEVDIASRHVMIDSEELPRLGGGKAVLLEMPVAVIPHAMLEIIFAARSRGLVPVLAHPERNELVQDRPERVLEWTEAGAALQIDGDSLLDVWGKRSKRCAESLLKRGLCHALASDAHSCEKRPPRMTRALAAAVELIGEHAHKLVAEGPLTIIAGTVPATPFYPPLARHHGRSSGGAPGQSSGGGLFSRLLGRG